MLTDEGRFMIGLILFLFGIFAFGYFVGWARDKLTNKIFDKMLEYHDSKRHWQGRFHEMQTNYYDLMKEHKELKEFTIELVDKKHVPEKWGGELKDE